MPDYDKFRSTASRLIKNSGVLCTLVKFSQEPGDATKPWLGPDSARDDDDSVITSANAVFVSMEASMLGLMLIDQNLFRNAERTVLIEPVEGVDFTDYNELYIGTPTTSEAPPELITMTGGGAVPPLGEYTRGADLNGRPAWYRSTYRIYWSGSRWRIDSGLPLFRGGTGTYPGTNDWTLDPASDQFGLISPVLSYELGEEVTLPTDRWKIEVIQSLAPDNVPIMYMGALKR